MDGKKEVRTFEQAVAILRNMNIAPVTEKIALIQVLNRVLAEDVVSDTDMPPFNKAAMDGYACRKVDLKHDLQIIEEIPAGNVPIHAIHQGQCSKIMTGAMVPQGADFVLMKEDAELSGSETIQSMRESPNSNICYKGEDLKRGELVLQAGTRLLPAHIAMLAATGYSNPEVYKVPRVAVISTGNELIEPGNTPETGKIRNSNGPQLIAQCLQYGLNPDYLGIIPDDKTALQEILVPAIEKYELVIISGGVSVGDYDYIPEVLVRLGTDLLFHGLRVKPGKHVLMCRKNNHFIAGMPGNPVSSFVMFEMLLKPLFNKLLGITGELKSLRVPMANDYERRNSENLSFVPVSLDSAGKAVPLEYHGSAHIHAYSKATGIMEVPIGISNLLKDELVYVRPI